MGVTARALFALALAGCKPADAPGTVSLRVVGEPSLATVTIDDIVVGPLAVVAARGVALPPGTHRLTVEAPGFFPRDILVEAKAGSPALRLEVHLEPIPD